MFPAGSRGTVPDLSWPRRLSRVRRPRARLTFRNTISKLPFQAGSSEARAQPVFAARKSEMAPQQANRWVATAGPILIGSRQSPILRNRSAKSTPNLSIRRRRIHSGRGGAAVILSQIHSQATDFAPISDPGATPCFDRWKIAAYSRVWPTQVQLQCWVVTMLGRYTLPSRLASTISLEYLDARYEMRHGPSNIDDVGPIA